MLTFEYDVTGPVPAKNAENGDWKGHINIQPAAKNVRKRPHSNNVAVRIFRKYNYKMSIHFKCSALKFTTTTSNYFAYNVSGIFWATLVAVVEHCYSLLILLLICKTIHLISRLDGKFIQNTRNWMPLFMSKERTNQKPLCVFLKAE